MPNNITINPPWRFDPFQNIVNVSWGAYYVIVQFTKTWIINASIGPIAGGNAPPQITLTPGKSAKLIATNTVTVSNTFGVPATWGIGYINEQGVFVNVNGTFTTFAAAQAHAGDGFIVRGIGASFETSGIIATSALLLVSPNLAKPAFSLDIAANTSPFGDIYYEAFPIAVTASVYSTGTNKPIKIANFSYSFTPPQPYPPAPSQLSPNPPNLSPTPTFIWQMGIPDVRPNSESMTNGHYEFILAQLPHLQGDPGQRGDIIAQLWPSIAQKSYNGSFIPPTYCVPVYETDGRGQQTVPFSGFDVSPQWINIPAEKSPPLITADAT